MHHDHRTVQSGRFSPLRYPGGKGKMVSFVRQVVRENGLSDGLYVEPYAGGAAVAMELLLTEEVSRIAINDISPHIFCFWSSVLDRTEELCRMIVETPLSVPEWDRQKLILQGKDISDPLALGFATFYLNRTNRSGILNGGIIGGRAQAGEWTIGARYNAKELAARVASIANLRSRISLSNLDAIEFIKSGAKSWGDRTLVYLDPPYYVKGKGLYHHYYRHDDHVEVCQSLAALVRQKWIVSYDDAPEIAAIYSGTRWMRYAIGYSAREHTSGQELMFFGPSLAVPAAVGTMRLIEQGA
ncbi:MAG: DNA adenine methylase [Pseudotabrizicola sp.]|uniref:DNA adenine methylase n=1 Tax=Pseudotabrizicola sp. TaxID=2939647 RepID=UPI00272226C0|nr:DNA adenine methylase [Pseudotabrizicola sp.]MDO9639701.1 DNA adenine methylase [Pseudotabrizicola sp.]